MKSHLVHNLDLSIYTECFGISTNPCVMLVMGATAQGQMWDVAFCQSLAEKGFFVIRYDHRDTGKSSRIQYSEFPYYLSDLAKDALAILDYYKIKDANFIAASMGSFIAQLIAINNPSRVKSLTLIMSSPNHHAFIDGFEGKNTNHHGLPPSNPNILEFYQKIISISSSSSDEINKIYKEIWLQIENHEDENLVNLRINEGKILRRLRNSKFVHNHSLALSNSPSISDGLSLITAPTLIIHGQIDYILPVEHAIKLHELMPNSILKIYQNMGHGFDEEIFNKLTKDLAFLKNN